MGAFSTFSRDATRSVYEGIGAQISFRPVTSNPPGDPIETLAIEPELEEPTELQYAMARPDYVQALYLLIEDVGANVGPDDEMDFLDGAHQGETWVIVDRSLDAVRDPAEIMVYARRLP